MSKYLRPQVPFNRSLRAEFNGQPIQVPVGLPPVRILPSQPGALGPEQGQLIALPGASFAPAGAVPKDEYGDANIAPGGTATLIQIAVPDGLRFRVAAIGFGADDETALGFLTWNMRESGDQQTGYNAVPASIGSIQQPSDVFHVSGSSVLFSITATSAATAVVTYRFICRVRGWFYADKVV